MSYRPNYIKYIADLRQKNRIQMYILVDGGLITKELMEKTNQQMSELLELSDYQYAAFVAMRNLLIELAAEYKFGPYLDMSEAEEWVNREVEKRLSS